MSRLLPLGLALAAALLLTACGGSNPKLIPEDRAQRAQGHRRPDRPARRRREVLGARRARCGGPATRSPSCRATRRRRLKDNLNEWLDQVASRIEDDCKPAETPTPTHRVGDRDADGDPDAKTPTATPDRDADGDPDRPPRPRPSRCRRWNRRTPAVSIPGMTAMADELFADRYRLEHRLGVGGMSTVQLAFDTRLERYVAVKLLAEHLAEDRSFVARFRREALAAARLVHPNVVQVFDFGLDDDTGRNFIVMEHVDGQSCAEILRDQGARPPEEAVAHPHAGLPRPRLRPPQRRRAPRRQAGQPAAQPRGRGQARRLRHRQGGRGLRDHEGRLRARHRRLPLTRAGARREGRAAGRPLRARGRLLPAADGPPALRGGLADRPRPPAGGQPAAVAERRQPGRAARARRGRHARAAPAARGPLRGRARDGDALEDGLRGVAPDPTDATAALDPTSATRMLGDPTAATRAEPRRPAERTRRPLEPLDEPARRRAARARRGAGAAAAPARSARARSAARSARSSASSCCSG